VTLACPPETRTKANPVRNQFAKPKLLKCAVYTRKSSEEGLEQDFNSLHAQRESCEAYIKSQKHEGWLALPILYDGGYYLYYVTSEGSGRHPAPPGQAKLRLPAADVDAFVVRAVQKLLADNTGLAKLLRAAHVRSGRLAEALKTAEAASRGLEGMPFQSRLELVTDLIARIDVMQAGLRITFGIAGIVRYLSGGKNSNRPPGTEVISVDFPMPSIVQNGSVKLVVTQPSQSNEDASLIAAIARGTCWFEELTSGKALSISSIASREMLPTVM
jgi:hypothetical protein